MIASNDAALIDTDHSIKIVVIAKRPEYRALPTAVDMLPLTDPESGNDHRGSNHFAM